jgi:hypothetical protein
MTPSPNTQSKEVEWEKEFEKKWFVENGELKVETYLEIMEFIKNVIMETEVRCGIRAFKEVMLEREATESRVRREMVEIENKYQELIMAVGNKYPGETRHQTALRYIKNAEVGENRPSKSLLKETK